MIRESQNCRRHCWTGGSVVKIPVKTNRTEKVYVLANILAVLAFFALLFFAYVAFA